MYEDWLKIVGDFENIRACPRCGERKIKLQYVGDAKIKIGHLYIWCEACLHGVHVSRVLIPEGVDFLPFGVSSEELSRKIPKYKLIS